MALPDLHLFDLVEILPLPTPNWRLRMWWMWADREGAGAVGGAGAAPPGGGGGGGGGEELVH